MKKIISFALIFFMSIASCNKKYTRICLPGKIAIIYMPNDDSCWIFENSDSAVASFNIKNNENVSYGGFTWLNCRDSFVGLEYVKNTVRKDQKGNVVVFDLNGKIIERIYEAQKGENAGLIYPSRSDRYLLITSERVEDLNINPIEGLMRMNSIVVMDLQKKQIITTLENVGRSPNFYVNESPWLYDEKRFLYSITNENKIVFQNKDETSVKDDSVGIYMYDITTNKKNLLVLGGRYGVCSPANLEIAYIKDKTVWKMDLKNNTKKMIYEGGSIEKVSDIHWTPDGNYIYIASYNPTFLNLLSPQNEKLIDVKTEKEIPFKKIGQGFQIYTWK